MGFLVGFKDTEKFFITKLRIDWSRHYPGLLSHLPEALRTLPILFQIR
jgi:hypothetical protein